MNRGKILKEAKRLTTSDRNKDYGPPQENMADIAATFNAVTGHQLTARDAAIFNVCQKLCRMKTSPKKADSYIDGAAYFAIAGECADCD